MKLSLASEGLLCKYLEKSTRERISCKTTRRKRMKEKKFNGMDWKERSPLQNKRVFFGTARKRRDPTVKLLIESIEVHWSVSQGERESPEK